jgi:hypothetical protein|tara:strand:+ start:148 stop:534 length:387 start_codon:yes stop_codon:yes gene_type:complete
MKKISLSWLHLLIVAITFLYSFTKGQDRRYIPVPDPILIQEQHNLVERPEIIAYQLVPGKDNYCHFEIQIIEAFAWNNIPEAQRFETEEIVIDRIVFEATNPWAINEMFYIDDKAYFLVRVPYQGHEW